MAVVLSGCQPTVAPEINNPITSEQQENISVRKIEPSSLPADILDWTEVSRYTGDVDGDGANENVVLVTEAKKDKNGELLWNDGQNWALYVDGSEKDYVLFKNYVNIGNVYFEVSDYYMKDGVVPRINLILSTGASFSLKGYSFSSKSMAYEEYTLYNSGNEAIGAISRKHSSIPQYID